MFARHWPGFFTLTMILWSAVYNINQFLYPLSSHTRDLKNRYLSDFPARCLVLQHQCWGLLAWCQCTVTEVASLIGNLCLSVAAYQIVPEVSNQETNNKPASLTFTTITATELGSFWPVGLTLTFTEVGCDSRKPSFCIGGLTKFSDSRMVLYMCQ